MLTIQHRVIQLEHALSTSKLLPRVSLLLRPAGATLAASKPVFWQTATLNDFLRGEVENLSVDGHGRLVLGPATELVADTTSPFLWAMAVAPDGAIYVGSGNEGKVFKVDGGKTTTFFDATELEVHALALAPDGTLYAATSPEGRIYKIDRSGKSAPVLRSRRQVHLEPGARRIREIFTPAPARKGVIYKITPDGKGSAVLSDQGHPRHYARLRTQRAAARGHRGPGPALSHRHRRKSVSAARLDVPGNSRAFGSIRRAIFISPRSAAARPAGASRPSRRPRATPSSSPAARAGADGDDRGHGDCGRRHWRRQRRLERTACSRRPARWVAARSTGSARRACGTSSGSRPTTRPTT